MKRITKIDKTEPLIPKKLRVAAYCRVSTGSDEQLVSLEAQKSHYESFIKANPEWESAGVYYDEGITGTKKEKRTQLLKLISDCEAHKVDFIVVKSISRFARNTTDCLELVRKLTDLGVFIYFEKENINTQSMESELMLSILSSLAASESVSIPENSKWGVKRRFQNGTFKIPYWFAFAKYVNDHQKRLVMVNPFSVKKIKELDDNSPKKTDSKDPKTIAKLVVDGRYSIPYMPEGIYAEIRDLVYSREPIWII